MKFSNLPFLALWTVVNAEQLASKQMQINYFDGPNCDHFLHQIDVTWATKHLDKKHTNCYNYNYGTSLALVQCTGAAELCDCTFYFNRNCESGSEGPFVTNNGRCFGQASRFQSFRCFYK